MTRKTIKPLLWLIVALALIPAGILAVQRLNVEGRATPIAVLLDEVSLHEQAALYGREPFELALHYQALGLPGIALYEDDLDTLAYRGAIIMLNLNEFNALAVSVGEEPSTVPWNATVVAEVEPGALDGAFANSVAVPVQRELAGRTWYLFPGDLREMLPAGPNRRSVEQYYEAGFDIAYRPLNAPIQTPNPGADYPPEANYIIHNGSIIDGFPGELSHLIDAAEPYYTAIIESTPQAGMPDIALKVPTVRLLSFHQDHINRRLYPSDLVDKYLLAVEERNIRLLYIRPYTTNELGDPLTMTEEVIEGLVQELTSYGYEVGPLANERLVLEPHPLLRYGAGLGVLAALALLALAFPGRWSLLVLVGVPAIAFVFTSGSVFATFALLAALVFPVLGFLTANERLLSLFTATGISLLGAVFLAAVGSETTTINALEPFRGVGLTLVLPPALFIAGYLLQRGSARQWLTNLWNIELRGSHVLLGSIGVAVISVVVLRRGNDPIIGVTDIELLVRQALGELTARPRFKELIGHPAVVVALAAAAATPLWARTLLLTLGVIAQASILNSFSHYHTPLPISLERTVVALIIGLVLGIPLAFAWRAIKGWWDRAGTR